MLTIYKASAGSGKTFNLAYEYIKALLGEKVEGTGKYRLNDPRKFRNKHRSILAITFTHKATEEMKSRIIKELSLLSIVKDEEGKDPSKYAANLCKQLGCTREKLADASHVAREQLLFDFHYFNVSTIDSFFQLVLRTFAYDIDKPGDYDVELNDEYAVAQGVSGMFSMLQTNRDETTAKLSEWLRKFMVDRVKLGTTFNVFDRQRSVNDELQKFVGRMCGEEYKRLMVNAPKQAKAEEDFYAYWDEYTAKLERYKQEIDQYPEVLHNQLKAQIVAVNQMVAANPGCELNKALASRFADWATKKPNTRQFNIKAITEVLSDNSLKDYNRFYASKECVSPASLDEAIESVILLAKRLVVLRKVCALISKQVYNLGLLEYTSRFVEQYCKENNLILLSETNRLLHTIIGGSSMPFVYDRLGVAIEHLLIDEFQDTSRMQWENLQPLIDNSLAIDGDSLIIGDEKQSIYRFRNADSSLLGHEVEAEYRPRGQSVTRGLCKEENTNYRSSADVIKFNNTLFFRLAKMLNVPGYNNVKQAIPADNINKRGYVRLIDLTSRLAKQKKEDFMQMALDCLVEDIQDQMRRGYQPSDIAVLVRIKEEGNAVVSRLISEGIPVASEESLLLTNSTAVRLIIGVLRIIESSILVGAQNESRSKAIRREIMQILSRFEYNLSALKRENEEKNLGESEVQLNARAVEMSMAEESEINDIVDRINARKSSNLITLVELVIKECIPEEERRIQNPYLVALQDRVLEFCSRGTSDLYSFLKWWDDVSGKLAIPASSQNAVSVMTIHKSKGLEFDCVHIPFLRWGTEKHDEAGWYTQAVLPGMAAKNVPYIISLPADAVLGESEVPVALRQQYQDKIDAQHSDNLNLTYVAFTRAVYELTCYYMTKDDVKYKYVGPIVHKALRATMADDEKAQAADGPEFAFDIEPFNERTDDGVFSGLFVLGEPTFSTKKAEESKDNAPEYVFVERKDLGRHIACQVTDDITDDDDEEDDGENLSSKSLDEYRSSEERERGTFLHDVLSMVTTPDTLDRAFRRTLRRHRVSAENEPVYKKILHDGLHSGIAKVDEWFNGYEKVMNERSIFDATVPPSKKVPTQGRTCRPDRIVWTADGHVDVVDYKFTHEPLPDHENQVSRYMWRLRSMGIENVRGYLWYPMLNIVKQVDFKYKKKTK